MQPYLFPYINYFQLISRSDIFISYNSADFIQRGWVNRNKILISHLPEYFTVPVKKSSLGTPISEISISDYIVWKDKFLKTLYLYYKKAPFFNDVYNLIENILNNKNYTKISNLALDSIIEISKYLNFNTSFVETSEIEFGSNLNKYQKLEFLIEYFNASEIILPTGSKELYNEWCPKNCLKTTIIPIDLKYNQNQREFVNNLSIIDVLMFNDLDGIKELLKGIPLNEPIDNSVMRIDQ